MDAVFQAVQLLGGIEGFVKQGDSVLIKPNLLSAAKPEEVVTTHPEIIRAVIRLVKKAGGRPLVGDSPGNFLTVRDIDFVYEKTGMKRVAGEEGAELIRFQKARIINGYPIAEAAFNASSIISVPKLKTHMLTMMTGAIKNSFGLVPGVFKTECHMNKPKPKDFAKVVLDIFETAKPRLFIMDGVVAMEGDGPAVGTPREAGLILASPDAVSMDAVISELVGFPSYKDVIVNEARRRGTGEADIANIQIVGEEIEKAKIKDFKLAKTGKVNLLPSFLIDIITGVIDFRPVINGELCKKCGVCKNSCPANAITINEQISRIDKKLCTKCFCCHEVCPYKAIYIKKNLIASILWRD